MLCYAAFHENNFGGANVFSRQRRAFIQTILQKQ